MNCANNGYPDQMPHFAESDLDLHCFPIAFCFKVVKLFSHKKKTKKTTTKKQQYHLLISQSKLPLTQFIRQKQSDDIFFVFPENRIWISCQLSLFKTNNLYEQMFSWWHFEVFVLMLSWKTCRLFNNYHLLKLSSVEICVKCHLNKAMNRYVESMWMWFR